MILKVLKIHQILIFINAIYISEYIMEIINK